MQADGSFVRRDEPHATIRTLQQQRLPRSASLHLLDQLAHALSTADALGRFSIIGCLERDASDRREWSYEGASRRHEQIIPGLARALQSDASEIRIAALRALRTVPELLGVYPAVVVRIGSSLVSEHGGEAAAAAAALEEACAVRCVISRRLLHHTLPHLLRAIEDTLRIRVRRPLGGSNTTGPSTTGPSTTGPSTTGPSTSGPSTSGPSTSGPSTTGPSTTRPSTTGPSTTVPSTRGMSTRGMSTPLDEEAAPSSPHFEPRALAMLVRRILLLRHVVTFPQHTRILFPTCHTPHSPPTRHIKKKSGHTTLGTHAPSCPLSIGSFSRSSLRRVRSERGRVP